MMRLAKLTFLAFAAIGLCATQAAGADAEFPEAVPESVGVDSRSLVKLSQWIRDEQLEIPALLVLKDGQLIFERYSHGMARDDRFRFYTPMTSIPSTLIGILIDEGKIASQDTKIAEILAAGPDADRLRTLLDDKRDISVGDVLSMTSGLGLPSLPIDKSSRRFDRLMFVLSAPVETPPGTRHQFSVSDPVLVEELIVAASGMSVLQFATQRLFEPLGMRLPMPITDPSRLDVESVLAQIGGPQLRPIDLAKFGQLFLDRGVWNGKRVVSEDWIERATTPKLVPFHGYSWWIGGFGEGSITAGLGVGQHLILFPRRNLAIVMAFATSRGLEHPFAQRVVSEFILPAAAPGAAGAPAPELKRDLDLELYRARFDKPDLRR